MDLYLIRHAEAVAAEDSGDLADEDRPLTDAGREQAQRLAQALPGRGARIERLFFSPTLRTRQTAEPLIASWGLGGDSVVECEELALDGKIRKLVRRIAKQPAATVGLVGHRPYLNEFAAWLIGSKKAKIALDKGGVALIRIEGDELEKGSGELVWLLPQGWA